MSRVAIIILGVLSLVSLGCDRKWDFECTAAWSHNGTEVWKKVYVYPQMADEHAATARCKEAMLEAQPKRANAAVCKCVGQE